MTATPEQVAALSEALDPSRVAQVQVGGGRSAGYLKAYDVIETANRIFGFDGWSYRVIGTPECNEAGVYSAIVEVAALGVTRTDIGTNPLQGGQSGPQASHHEMSMKGAVSDALKRALRTFGAQFGNDLYEKDTPARGGVRRTPERPQRQEQSRSEAVNAGNLLSWAFQEHNLNRTAVLSILGVEKPSDITDFDDAKKKITEAVK